MLSRSLLPITQYSLGWKSFTRPLLEEWRRQPKITGVLSANFSYLFSCIWFVSTAVLCFRGKMLLWNKSLYAASDCVLFHFWDMWKCFLLGDTSTDPVIWAHFECIQPPIGLQDCNWAWNSLKRIPASKIWSSRQI